MLNVSGVAVQTLINNSQLSVSQNTPTENIPEQPRAFSREFEQALKSGEASQDTTQETTPKETHSSLEKSEKIKGKKDGKNVKNADSAAKTSEKKKTASKAALPAKVDAKKTLSEESADGRQVAEKSRDAGQVALLPKLTPQSGNKLELIEPAEEVLEAAEAFEESGRKVINRAAISAQDKPMPVQEENAAATAAELHEVFSAAGNDSETKGDLPDRDPRESVSTNAKRGTAAIEVRDYRTGSDTEAVKAAESTGSSRQAVEAEENGPELKLVRSAGYNVRTLSSDQPRTVRADSSFSAYVRENLSSEIVKQSGIILRNNNKGEIRLVLKPENLGRVRVRIQLDENRISGRIFVDNGFVKENFDQNLESLYRSFRNSGFDASEFEVLVDGRENNNESGGKRERSASAKNIRHLDEAVPILEEIGRGSDLVNLVV